MGNVTSEYYPTGDIDHDIVGEFFKSVYEAMNKPDHCLVEVKDFRNSDTRLSILWYNNKAKAFVIESRTEFNNINIIKGEIDDQGTEDMATIPRNHEN